MSVAVHAGARLDRLPFGPFHWRMLRLIGLGIFFDGFDNSMGPSVLAALTKNGWSNMATSANFISVTFAGLALGAFLSGVLGDRLGRRFAYQFNLAIFGVTCLLSAVAPSMTWLIVLRGIMGVGIGAEYVIGYSMACEFVPPQRRGWALGIMAFASMSSGFVVSLLAVLLIPHFGWRPLYVIGGGGALFVWFLRRKLPEIAALAGEDGPHRGGGTGDRRNRAGGVGRGAVAAAAHPHGGGDGSLGAGLRAGLAAGDPADGTGDLDLHLGDGRVLQLHLLGAVAVRGAGLFAEPLAQLLHHHGVRQHRRGPRPASSSPTGWAGGGR